MSSSKFMENNSTNVGLSASKLAHPYASSNVAAAGVVNLNNEVVFLTGATATLSAVGVPGQTLTVVNKVHPCTLTVSVALPAGPFVFTAVNKSLDLVSDGVTWFVNETNK